MNCCKKNNQKTENKERGVLTGLIYGLVPHIGCIGFIVFSVLGVTAATAIFKPLLLNPYFFHILIALAFVFATIAAFFYFQKQGFITLQKSENGLEFSFIASGLKRKWKYLLTLYGTTIGINLLLFMIIFPIAANVSAGSSLTASIIGAFGGGEKLQLSESSSLVTLQVNIPCPGHAPLITGELKKISGVENIRFRFPNLFDVAYNPEKTSTEQIVSLDVFNTYKATVVSGETAKGKVPVDGVGGSIERVQVPANIGGSVVGCVTGCVAGCEGAVGGCGYGCGIGR